MLDTVVVVVAAVVVVGSLDGSVVGGFEVEEFVGWVFVGCPPVLVGWVWVSSTVVVVVVPSGRVTVVTRVRRVVVVAAVVVLVLSVVVVVVSAVVVVAEVDLDSGTVVRVLRDTTSSRGVGAAGAAPGLAPAIEAIAANTVDTTTPDAASSTGGDTRGRGRSGSGVSYNGAPMGRSVGVYQPKFCVQYQPRVSRPTPMVVKPQLRMLRRWPSEFIQARMTCSAERWPLAMFSPPGLG